MRGEVSTTGRNCPSSPDECPAAFEVVRTLNVPRPPKRLWNAELLTGSGLVDLHAVSRQNGPGVAPYRLVRQVAGRIKGPGPSPSLVMHYLSCGAI